jgi:hypothetical protein
MNVEKEKIEALINILQSMLVPESKEDTQEEPINDVAVIDKKKKTTATTKNTRGKSRPKKVGFINKFDSMSERRMHKEDSIIDKKLSVIPPVPRERHFELVEVKCRICGKQEEVSPALITDSAGRYKCNNCSTNSG